MKITFKVLLVKFYVNNDQFNIQNVQKISRLYTLYL